MSLIAKPCENFDSFFSGPKTFAVAVAYGIVMSVLIYFQFTIAATIFLLVWVVFSYVFFKGEVQDDVKLDTRAQISLSLFAGLFIAFPFSAAIIFGYVFSWANLGWYHYLRGRKIFLIDEYIYLEREVFDGKKIYINTHSVHKLNGCKSFGENSKYTFEKNAAKLLLSTNEKIYMKEIQRGSKS